MATLKTLYFDLEDRIEMYSAMIASIDCLIEGIQKRIKNNPEIKEIDLKKLEFALGEKARMSTILNVCKNIQSDLDDILME